MKNKIDLKRLDCRGFKEWFREQRQACAVLARPGCVTGGAARRASDGRNACSRNDGNFSYMYMHLETVHDVILVAQTAFACARSSP